MASQFNSIIEKIKTDKNVQVAVASIAAATVLVISCTTYYISQSHSQATGQTYKKVVSIGSEKSERYEKLRKDDASDTHIDDKLVESISSATSSSSNSSNVDSSSTADSSSSRSNSSLTRSNQESQSNHSSTVQTTSSEARQESSEQSNDQSEIPESPSTSVEKENPSKKEASKPKVLERRSTKRSVRSKRSTDQSDWNDGQNETKKPDAVSGDSWNDEDVVEEINTDR